MAASAKGKERGAYMIKGITVTLYEKTQTGVDGFGKATYTETPVEVDNVLVAPATNEEVVNELQLTGKKLAYNMALPKGDTHAWTNRKVSFLGKTFQSYGDVEEGIEENVPTPWHKKVKVMRID